MLRYHKEVYFNDDLKNQLKSFTDNLNLKSWRYTVHSIDNLKYRVIDIEALLKFIKDLKLNEDFIFEVYQDGKDIIKACYRIRYINNQDIILVMGINKDIITIYLNSANDKHETLKKELYQKN